MAGLAFRGSEPSAPVSARGNAANIDVATTVPFDRSILAAIATFRWMALLWACIGVFLARDKLDHSVLAVACLVAAFAVSGAATAIVATVPRLLMTWKVVLFELMVGIAITIGDGFVFGNNDVPLRPQSLPWAWPSAGIIAAAVAFGPRVGFVTAALMTVARFFGEGQVHGFGWSMRLSGNAALYAVTAVATGFAVQRLRNAEKEISTVRAREEMSRTLHDGVLQTLAVIQRRSSDPELAALAREQERDLRDYLFGTNVTEAFPVAIRDLATRVERQHGVSTNVVLAPDLPPLDDAESDALAGAAGEALTNAAKHSGSQRITIYAEPSADGEGVFCSVKDDGCGFDVDADHVGEGLKQSIRARIAEVGGRVEIDSRPDRGTEVRLWVN